MNYLETLFSLKGKTAIITGGSKGIGAEIALAFLNAGANIVCVSRSNLAKKKEINKFYKQCDITIAKEFNAICEYTISRYDNIDILVNAAGVSLPANKSLSNIDRFKKTLDINLTSLYQCCDIASRHMNNGGSILNITSIGSIMGFPNNPGYISSKGGVKMLTKSLAIDLSTNGIRVNNIAPGYIKTDMTKDSYENKQMHQERINRMIINRWGEVTDIIGAAIFLASDSSSYITGSEIVIDGGWTTW